MLMPTYYLWVVTLLNIDGCCDGVLPSSTLRVRMVYHATVVVHSVVRRYQSRLWMAIEEQCPSHCYETLERRESRIKMAKKCVSFHALGIIPPQPPHCRVGHSYGARTPRLAASSICIYFGVLFWGRIAWRNWYKAITSSINCPLQAYKMNPTFTASPNHLNVSSSL